MEKDDLTYLSFLLDQDPAVFREILLNHDLSAFTAMDPAGFSQRLGHLLTHPAMDPHLKPLFHLYLMSRCLLSEPEVFQVIKPILGQFFDIQPYLGIHMDVIKPGKWTAIPVVLTSGRQAVVRHFMLGRMGADHPSFIMPSWAFPLFDATALNAVATALALTRQNSTRQDPGLFVCYPYTLPQNTLQFREGSLALPLYLGFRSLDQGMVPPRQLIASGAMADDGSLKRTGCIKTKWHHVSQQYEGFLYPGPLLRPRAVPAAYPYAVNSIQHAWMLYCLYSRPHADKLQILSGMAEDAAVFAGMLCLLPCLWIQWIQHDPIFCTRMSEVLENRELFLKWIKGMADLVRTFDLEAAAAMAALISPEQTDRLMGQFPLAALKWCTVNLSLANHQGDPAKGHEWKKKGLHLIPGVIACNLDPVADFFNHALVTDHNRYVFHPQLPGDLTRLKTFLEDQHRIRCRAGCTIDPVLGRIYGTIMQNYAFCGPAHFKETCFFSRKARKALGESIAKELGLEWRRHYHYLAYACLDFGDLPQARDRLLQYFETDRIEAIFKMNHPLSAWHYALLARFFSDQPGHPLFRQAYGFLKNGLSFAGRVHPWPLVACNLGRMALCLGKYDQAIQMLMVSARTCLLDTAGPTLRVMALLPLSGLLPLYQNHPNHFNPSNLPPWLEWEHQIRSAAETLDEIHFSFLTAQGFEDALAQVRQQPETIFPFTLR